MPGNEIEVPKEIREFMPDNAHETILGQKNGADKQYRYGHLHIREYPDKFLVHTDRVDPRQDPVGHLIRDAPEILIGLACASFTGLQNVKKSNKKSSSLASEILFSIGLGYLGYIGTKKIKNYLE